MHKPALSIDLSLIDPRLLALGESARRTIQKSYKAVAISILQCNASHRLARHSQDRYIRIPGPSGPYG